MGESAPPIGRRIQVIGPSCSGKSTLGPELARRFGLEFVELDALFWKPNWQQSTDEEFAEALKAATSGGGFVIAGNYSRHTIHLYWKRLDTVVWLDFPLRTIIPSILARSWRRSRSKELLWGTNHERFWGQLKLWDQDSSLITYAVRNRRRAHERFTKAMADPELRHIRWVRLTSRAQVRGWLATLQR